MNKSIFVVVPAYNEAAVIGETLRELLLTGCHVVVVNDASTDETAREAKKIPVHYVEHAINLGQGAALQTGIDYALQKGAEVIVTFDADGQHQPGDIARMVRALEEGKADIVFGSRFHKKAMQTIPFVRRCLLQAARYFNWIMTGILLSDAHNGLRAMNTRAARALRLTENRMAHATEFLLLVRKHRLKYLEIPVEIRYTAYSRHKGQKNSHIFKVAQDILLYKIFR